MIRVGAGMTKGNVWLAQGELGAFCDVEPEPEHLRSDRQSLGIWSGSVTDTPARWIILSSGNVVDGVDISCLQMVGVNPDGPS